MITDNIKQFLMYTIIFYLTIVSVIYLVNEGIFFRMILWLSFCIIAIWISGKYMGNSLKLLLENADNYVIYFVVQIIVFIIFLVFSLFSLFFGIIITEGYMGIKIFDPDDSFLSKFSGLFFGENEFGTSHNYFIAHFLWFIISLGFYTVGIIFFNNISEKKNDGFNLDHDLLLRPLLKHYTLFVGLVAVMAIGVTFIEHDNYVYDLENDTLYRVVALTYEVDRIEKLTTQELNEFNKTFEVNDENPPLDYFMFSLLFLIPYIHLTYKIK